MTQDVRVRRRQAPGRRRRRLRQPHADRARRRRHGDGDRRSRRPAHGAERSTATACSRPSPTRPARRTASPTTTPAACSRASRSPSGATTRFDYDADGPADAPPRRRRRGAHADPHRGRVRPDGDDQDRGRQGRPSTRWRCSPTATAAAPCRSPSGAKTVSVVAHRRHHRADRARRHQDRGRVRARSPLGRRGADRRRQDRDDAERQDDAHQAHRHGRAARPARPVLDHRCGRRSTSTARLDVDLRGPTRPSRRPDGHAAQRRGPRDGRRRSTARAACSSRRSAPAWPRSSTPTTSSGARSR